MGKLIKNKRADVTDIMTIGFWLLVIAIGIIAVMFASFSLIEPLKDTIIGEDANALAAIISWENYTSYAIPGAFLVIFFGLLLGLVVSAFFIRTHPIFLPVYILFAIISIIVSVAIGNVWGNIKDVEEFAEILELNTVIGLVDIILSNIVLVTLIAFILSIIIIFAKPGGGRVEIGGSTPF